MSKIKLPITLALFSALIVFVAASAEARPRPQVKSRTALLEVAEKDGRGKARVTRLTLTLIEDQAPSRVEFDDGKVRYGVSISCRSAGASAAVVRLELQRGKRGRWTKVAVGARVALGRRVELGRIDRHGGDLRLAVTLR